MAFIRYSNLPIRIVANNGQTGVDSLKLFLARQFSFQNSSTISQARVAGKVINPTDYTPTGNREASMSMSLYLDGTEGIEELITNLIYSNDPQTLVVGQTVLEYCYLDSLSFNLEPFMPTVMELSFRCYKFVTPEITPSLEVDTRLLDLANGAASTIKILNSDTEIEDILNGSFSISITREPIYTPGELVPTRVNLIDAEMSIQIRCSSFGKFLDYTGENIQFQFYVRTPQGATCFTHKNFTGGVDYLEAKCSSQDTGFDEGGYTISSFSALSILV